MTVHKNYFRLLQISAKIEPVYNKVKSELELICLSAHTYSYSELIQKEKELKKEYLDFISRYFEEIAELTGNCVPNIKLIATEMHDKLFTGLGSVNPESLRNIALGTGTWVIR